MRSIPYKPLSPLVITVHDDHNDGVSNEQHHGISHPISGKYSGAFG